MKLDATIEYVKIEARTSHAILELTTVDGWAIFRIELKRRTFEPGSEFRARLYEKAYARANAEAFLRKGTVETFKEA